MRIVSTTLALSVALALGAACSEKKEEAAPAEAAPAEAAPAEAAPAEAAPAEAAPAAAADPAAEAKNIFDTRCVTCHGATGAGDGPGAAALNPKPRAYSDKEWQAKVTDENLAKAIVEGGPAVGLSPLMPPNPDLKAKPEVVAEIVKMIRAFGG